MTDPKRSPAGDAFAAFAITVLQLAGHLNAAGDALARPAGQSAARWQVLAAAEHGSFSVAQIAKTLGLARQGIQRIADVLAKEGLVRYADNPAHRRAKLVLLTLNGRAVLDEIQARQTVWANALGRTLGEDDLRAACQVLERALDAVQAP
jgi:DNA-binding MarR family transcriptional regulator